MRGTGPRACPKPLLADDQDGKGAGLHLAAAFTGSWGIKFSRRKKDVVGLQVEAHGAGGSLGGNVLDNGELVRRVLVDDGEISVAAGGKGVIGGWIEAGSVRTLADLRSCDHFASVRVDDGHDFFVANGKETTSLEIHGKAGGRFARGERPTMGFGEFPRVELDEFGFVFDVDENAALAVSNGEFGFAAESEGARDCAVGGVDGSGVLAAAVKSENSFGDAVVDNGVRIGVGLYSAESF